MDKILYDFKVFLLNLSAFARKDYTANTCGHKTKQSGEVFSASNNFVLKMPLASNGCPDYCLDCVSKMSIRCAWCGDSIHIGDPVTLYTPKPEFEIPKHAVRYSDDETRLIGCLKWSCADSGVDRQGFWITPGKVQRLPSPIEMLAANKSENGLLVNHLLDPNDVGKFI